MKVKSLSHVRLFANPWTAAYQAPPSMGFPGKNTGVGCHCLLQPLSTKIVQRVGLSDELQKVHISEAILFFRPFENTHHFFLSSFTPTYLFGQDFLGKYARIFLSHKEEILYNLTVVIKAVNQVN